MKNEDIESCLALTRIGSWIVKYPQIKASVLLEPSLMDPFEPVSSILLQIQISAMKLQAIKFDAASNLH